jgi:hypothetical protein
MEIITQNTMNIAVADKTMLITKTQDILDIMATAHYVDQCSAIILFRESLPETFFDLKTGFAGEVLQKFSNYRTKLAIIGDFSSYTSKSLKDFIYECNSGNLVFFKADIESAIAALTE